MKSARKCERSYFFMYSARGSSRLIARNAVGAVKRVGTLCCSMTRQKVPALGVPTGLPSKTIVVQPCSSGA